MSTNNIKPDKYIGNWFVSSIGSLLSGHLLIYVSHDKSKLH